MVKKTLAQFERDKAWREKSEITKFERNKERRVRSPHEKKKRLMGERGESTSG